MGRRLAHGWSVTLRGSRVPLHPRNVTNYRARVVAATLGAGAVILVGGVAVAVPVNAAATAGSTAARGAQAGSHRAGPLGDGTPGYCPDKTGVTVVVDFNQLGGGIVVRCAPGPIGSGYTGLDALQDAGFKPEGTARWGMQFICRIAGKPAPDQKLAITGDPNYQEKCIDTPPAEAFWSYWYAPNGGTWTLSADGPANRDAIPGGFEGWSFSLNHTQDSAPPPGIDPTRPRQPPPTSTSPTSPPTSPPPSTPPSTHPTHGGGGGSGGSGGGSAPGTPTPPASTGAPSATPRHTAASRPGRAQGSAYGSTLSVSPAGTTSAGPDNPVAIGNNGKGEKVSGELPQSASTSSDGSPTAAIAGILVLAVLAGGGYVAYRRRRTDSG